MFHAIGEARIYLCTAKVKIGFAGMAHWPAADFVAQIEQAGLVCNFGAWLGRNQTARRCRGDGGLLIPRALPQKAAGADGHDLGQIG